MNTQEKIKQKEEQINKLQEQISLLKAQEESNNFIEAKQGKNLFRIYPWDKPVKDFIIPKGFRMSEEREFIDLYDSGFKIEKYPVIYFTRNRSKLNIKNGFGLSWVGLGCGLGLFTGDDSLAGSYEDGRVVLIKGEQTK